MAAVEQQIYPILASLPGTDVGNEIEAMAQSMFDEPAQTVTIPDLFVSFVSKSPPLSPYYKSIKGDSEAWMRDLCGWSEREYKKHIQADFPYFAAIWAQEAGRDEFRTIVDWCNWVFDFDDLFDDGQLRENPIQTREEVENLISTMIDSKMETSPEDHPLRYVFHSVWKRIDQRSSPGAKLRFIKSMKGFCNGLVGQVDVRYSASLPEIERYLALRRVSIGVFPCLALVEYFHALDLPDYVFEDVSVKELETIAADIVLLQNDILSYHKERSMDVAHNIIHLFLQQGISQQEAYSRTNDLLMQRYRKWYLAHSNIPIWGEEVDSQVQKYLKGCEDVVLGNLNWSFKSERYFGKDNEAVRRSRKVSLLQEVSKEQPQRSELVN